VFQFIHIFLCTRYSYQAVHSFILRQQYKLPAADITNPSTATFWTPPLLQLNCTPIPATLRPRLLCVTTIPASLQPNQSSYHTYPHLQETAWLPTWLLLLDCLTLRMKVLQFFEIFGNTQWHIVESSIMNLILGCFILSLSVLWKWKRNIVAPSSGKNTVTW
jgi:hypothetical protein